MKFPFTRSGMMHEGIPNTMRLILALGVRGALPDIQGGNTAKVTLCLSPGVLTTSDAVDRIALGSVSGNGSASGNAGDAQQNAAAPASSPPTGFDVRPLVTWPLSGGGAGAPRRPGVAVSAAFDPAGRWSAIGGDAYRGSGFPARCWSAAAPGPHSSGTGRANSSG